MFVCNGVAMITYITMLLVIAVTLQWRHSKLQRCSLLQRCLKLERILQRTLQCFCSSGLNEHMIVLNVVQRPPRLRESRDRSSRPAGQRVNSRKIIQDSSGSHVLPYVRINIMTADVPDWHVGLRSLRWSRANR